MLRHLLPFVTLALASPAVAQSGSQPVPDTYLDDRSSPERVVASLYNAIGRQEYLRAWSYFSQDGAPPYEAFKAGYADTATVELRTGEVATEGAAGSIHSSVPVALRATTADGTAAVYVGCYRLTQVQPAAQEVPPFRPIQIDEGRLEPSSEPFDSAMGRCD